jgi:hypothetical protein
MVVFAVDARKLKDQLIALLHYRAVVASVGD